MSCQYEPYPEDMDEYQQYLDDLGEGIYWQQMYEHDLQYFTRVADSHPHDAHWHKAMAWLEQENQRCNIRK